MNTPNYETLYRNIEFAKWLIYFGTRKQLIHWHEWNDSDGCYSDADCRAEGIEPIPTIILIQLLQDQVKDW